VTELQVPKWSLKDSASGDLNGDHRADMAVVLEYADTVTELRNDSGENTGKPRILLVLFWDAAAQAYNVNVQNNSFILRGGEGGMADDPYDGISIHHGVLEVGYQYVRSYLKYKFRFKSSAIYLIGASYAGAVGDKFENWDFNFSTGRAKHEWGEVFDTNYSDHVKWLKMKARSPIRLGDMRFAWEMEIFPSVYI
jgi:hypothetical protein